MRIIKAAYDGRSFHPDEPVALPPNTRVMLRLRAEPAEPDTDRNPLAAADIELPHIHETFADGVRRIRINGPPDWASRADHYLYGRDDDPVSDEEPSDPGS